MCVYLTYVQVREWQVHSLVGSDSYVIRVGREPYLYMNPLLTAPQDSSWLHMMNDSHGTMQLGSQNVTIDEEFRAITTRHVHKDEELLWNYRVG